MAKEDKFPPAEYSSSQDRDRVERVPRDRTILKEWEDRDKRAEEKAKKEKLSRKMSGPELTDIQTEQENRGGQVINELMEQKKGGGRVRGYSSGKRVKASGKPRGVGLAKGIRKAKMVKMKG